jgi:hypothetical protein
MQSHKAPSHTSVNPAQAQAATAVQNSGLSAHATQAALAVEATEAAQVALAVQTAQAQVHVQTVANTQFNSGGHGSYAHPQPPARPIQQRLDFEGLDNTPANKRQALGN